MSAREPRARCEGFERWLDGGAPAAGEAAARLHAASCPRCRRAWDAMRALDDLLAEPAATAPKGFTDAVMRRVAETRRASWDPLPWLEDPLPWWVRVATQPSAAMAAVVAALLIWQWAGILAAARVVSAWTGGGATTFLTDTLAVVGAAFGGVATVWAGQGASIQIAFALALLPPLLWASAGLARWGERLATRDRQPTVH